MKKHLPLLLPLVVTTLLAGCNIRMVSTTPDVVVVGEDVPPYASPRYTPPKPTLTYGQGSSNPIIQSFTANPTTQVPQGQPITFTVVAYDANRDVLQYNWSSTGGTLSTNTGHAVIWQPPTKPGVYTVMVTIANSRGGFVMGSLNLTVQADGTAEVAGGASGSPAPAATAAPTAAPSAAPTAAPTATPAPAGVGTVLGMVRTDSGPISGATVKLTDGKGFEATILSDDIGNYRFNNAPADRDLTLSATKDGFAAVTRTVKIAASQEAFFFLDMKK